MIAPVQLHGIVMATFASLVAPFGGFFASAVKRAFKIKDFGIVFQVMVVLPIEWIVNS